MEGDEVEHRIMRHSANWGFLAAEVFDNEDKVVVKLEAPGMQAENFDIQVMDTVLVVRGEKRVEHQEKRGRYHVMERAYGAFERAIGLPTEVDESGTRAKYRHGVLTISMPKHTHAKSRRIEVGSG
jgi:HSP20 family protein